jgi:alkylation response protein AidB-like acyl-CoA dehydrogenase
MGASNFGISTHADRATSTVLESHSVVLAALLEAIASTAAQRDAAGGTALHERTLIRQSGLLLLSIPKAYGGAGGNLNDALHVARRIATLDSSLAHLFAFHHFQLATLRFYAPETQWGPLFADTAAHGWFWGNALNPLDQRTVLARHADHFVINGEKSFCSGATDSDMLVVSALLDGVLKVAAIPTGRSGITVQDDWDNMGQRQTDSGSVSFANVKVSASEFLQSPGPLGSPFASLRSTVGQLILTNVYLGVAQGALDEARRYVLASVRPWLSSGVNRVEEDPYVLRNFGELWSEVAAARALTDEAQRKLQEALDLGDRVTPEVRGEVAVSVSTAKVVSSRAGLNVSSRIFEVMGARATAGKLRSDRFWRNVRTHTLHDPIDYKLRELGVWFLTGEIPKPSFYS